MVAPRHIGWVPFSTLSFTVSFTVNFNSVILSQKLPPLTIVS